MNQDNHFSGDISTVLQKSKDYYVVCLKQSLSSLCRIFRFRCQCAAWNRSAYTFITLFHGIKFQKNFYFRRLTTMNFTVHTYSIQYLKNQKISWSEKNKAGDCRKHG